MRLEAAGGSVTLNAAVRSGDGHLSIIGAQNVTQAAAGSLATGAGSIDVEATAGSVLVADGAKAQSGSGNIRYRAGANVTVTGVQAVAGNVSLLAGGNILDGGSLGLDVVAAGLRLQAGGTIGTAADGLETGVATMTALAGGLVRLLESDGITVGSVAVSVSRVGADGSVTVVTDAAQSDLVSAAGALVLETAGGTITVTDGNADGAGVRTLGAGNVLLNAGGAGSSVVLQTDVVLANGSVSVLARQDVTFSATADIRVAGETADVAATDGSVMMADGSVIQTDAANIRVRAGVDIVVGLVDARTVADRAGNTRTNQANWGEVSLSAVAGSITDAAAAGDGVVDVYARGARFTGAVAVGQVTPDNALETEVLTVTALAGNGGVNIKDASDLAVGTVGTVPGNRVQSDGTVAALADTGSQTGVVKGVAGRTVVQTGDGSNVANFPYFEVRSVLTLASVPRAETGWYEQVVRISNTTGSSIDAVRVAIGNLPVGVVVVDALGSVNGVQFIQYNQALAVGQTVDLIIEYYVPNNSTIPLAPTFRVDVVAPLPPLNPVGSVLAGVNVSRTVDNHYLLRFASLVGHYYEIQYSGDGVNWTAARPVLTGTGAQLAWVDNGPPKTVSDSSTVATRYYRVIIFDVL